MPISMLHDGVLWHSIADVHRCSNANSWLHFVVVVMCVCVMCLMGESL